MPACRGESLLAVRWPSGRTFACPLQVYSKDLNSRFLSFAFECEAPISAQHPQCRGGKVATAASIADRIQRSLARGAYRAVVQLLVNQDGVELLLHRRALRTLVGGGSTICPLQSGLPDASPQSGSFSMHIMVGLYRRKKSHLSAGTASGDTSVTPFNITAT